MDWIVSNPDRAAWLLGGAALIAALRAARGRERRLRELAAVEDGSAAVEFALAAPVLLGVILLTAQLTLMATAQRAVEAAAFAAARSAAVWIPADTGEGVNAIRRSGASPKRERMERAAALALLPVSPLEEEIGSPAEDRLAPALDALAREAGLGDGRILGLRYEAARRRLRIDLATERNLGGGGLLLVETDDSVAVTVTYDFPLNIPLAARALGRPDRGAGTRRAPLTARCAMRVENGAPFGPEITNDK